MAIRFCRFVVLIAGFLLALSSYADEAAPLRNFGVVVENGIYRGAQPDEAEIERLKAMGVRTVLKLNTHDLDEERAVCERLGIRLIHVPTKAETIAARSSCETVARALEAMTNRDNWPIYVHCQHGRDRTGYLVGLYRLNVEHWTWRDVDRELEHYGHKWKERVAFPTISRTLERGAPTCPP